MRSGQCLDGEAGLNLQPTKVTPAKGDLSAVQSANLEGYRQAQAITAATLVETDATRSKPCDLLITQPLTIIFDEQIDPVA